MGGGRIVVDPQQLRELATRMRGAALLLSSTGREVAVGSRPPMPAGVVGAVGEMAAHVNAELQDLALELMQEATMLLARATWAELGGGAPNAWLVPGLHLAPPRLPGGHEPSPISTLFPADDERLIAGERWAVEILDGMQDPIDPSSEEGDGLGGAGDVFASDLMEFADEFAGEIPPSTLGGLMLGAGAALDLYEHGPEGPPERVAGWGLSAGSAAAGGGLGVLFSSAALGATGIGLAGCLIAGGLGADLFGGHLGDEAID